MFRRTAATSLALSRQLARASRAAAPVFNFGSNSAVQQVLFPRATSCALPRRLFSTNAADEKPKATPNSDDADDKYSEEEQAELKNQGGEGAPAAEGATSDRNEIRTVDYDEYYDDEPQTKEGKFRQGFRTAFTWTLILTGIGCIVYLSKQLFGKHSVNGLFSSAVDSLKSNDEVRELVGDNMTAYGRENTGNQGRRNMIDSYEYETEDGDKRLRIRFHVEGNRTKLRVWAEVSDKLTEGDYAYLICQDLKTGRVITIQDNRQKLQDMATASGNTSLLKAFDQLRSGGGGSSN